MFTRQKEHLQQEDYAERWFFCTFIHKIKFSYIMLTALGIKWKLLPMQLALLDFSSGIMIISRYAWYNRKWHNIKSFTQTFASILTHHVQWSVHAPFIYLNPSAAELYVLIFILLKLELPKQFSAT